MTGAEQSFDFEFWRRQPASFRFVQHARTRTQQWPEGGLPWPDLS